MTEWIQVRGSGNQTQDKISKAKKGADGETKGGIKKRSALI